MEKLKLIQVGIGGWGYSWAGVVQESKYWEAVGYVDIEQQNLLKASETYGMSREKCFNDLNKALNKIECDAVLVVVPPKYHKEVVIKALENGKHVLVEKPLADTFPAAFEMVNKAEEVGKRLMVSQNYRFKRASRTVKNVIEKRIVGQPGYITINFHKATHFDSPFRLEMEEPLLRDMSIHHFDQMRYLLDENPVSVYAKTWNPSWSWFDGNAVAVVLVEFEDGTIVNYHGSWVTQGWETTWDGDWRLECTEGEIHWDNNKVIVEPATISQNTFNLKMLKKDNKLIINLSPMEVVERKYSLLEFYTAIKENREAETSGKDNIYSMALTFAAVESAKTNQKILIKDLLENNI